MKNCPVCATPAQDNENFCGVCGTLFSVSVPGGPEKPVTTTTSEIEMGPIKPALETKRKPGFYLPAAQFLLAVILLGYVLYITTQFVPSTDEGAANASQIEPYIFDSNGDGIDDTYTTLAIRDENYIYLSIFTGASILLLLIQMRRADSRSNYALMLFTLLLTGLVFVGKPWTSNPEIDHVWATMGAAAAFLLVIVSYLTFLGAVTAQELSEKARSTSFYFLSFSTLFFGSLYHNYFRGPWANSNAQVVVVNLQPIETIVVMVSLILLVAGVASFILNTVRIRDFSEARFFGMIMFGVILQFLVLTFNMIVHKSDLLLGPLEITLTFMAVLITAWGIGSFYLKRRREESMEGTAYFGLFVAGIATLFVFMVLPMVLSGDDLTIPEDPAGRLGLAIPLLVALTGLWLWAKYGSRKLRERLAALEAEEPQRLDPFTPPTAPGPAIPQERDVSLDEAMDAILREFPESTIDIKPTDTDSSEFIMAWDKVEEELMDDVDHEVKLRKAMKVDYTVDYEEISRYYSTTPDTINQVVTHLKSGRNVMLYGEPGTGKTALSTLLLTQLCGMRKGKKGKQMPNFTIVTANAEWSNFEVIGGIAPDDKGGYYFKDGYVSEAAKLCEESMQELSRPHYLVIDEFNRANIDEAFGKLFTVFEYRDKQPLLTHKETKGAPFLMPPEFRIFGTMNTQDKNSLFNIGHALMRRFAFVEIGLPDKEDEYNRMPIFVWSKIEKLGLAPERPEVERDWFTEDKFDFYDEDGEIFRVYKQLMEFLLEEDPPLSRDEEIPRGMRTFRKLGPASIIDSMLTIYNSRGQYEIDRALEDVIRANIMPSLEGLEKNELRCLMLKSQEVLGPDSAISHTLENMVESPGLSIFG